MLSFGSIVTVALALTTSALGSPAGAAAPEASVAPVAKVVDVKPLSAAQVTALGDITFQGVQPHKVVPYGRENGYIAYYDAPEGSEVAATKEADAPALQDRACGDNWDGGCDYNNNLSQDWICDSLVSWLTGNNDGTTLSFCYWYDQNGGRPQCCTSWRNGAWVPGWSLVNGIQAIRGRCKSNGWVSGWINSARLNNQCTAQCLSSNGDRC